MLTVVVMMLVLASGVALALNRIDCSTSTDPGDGICSGTSEADLIVGTDNDNIRALAGKDTVNGALGDDVIDGGRGSDQLSGGEGVDEIIGGQGNDIFDLMDEARVIPVPVDSSEIGSGGDGNDTTVADDGNQDLILCGAGKKDVVSYDQYDLFFADESGEFGNSPSPDCENATLVIR